MIKFDAENHKYYDEERGVELISVTTLLAKHGLAPDYSGVDVGVVRRKAERGAFIHKEIEDFVKSGAVGFSTEFSNFLAYITDNNIKILASEKIVYNDIVAGTFDLLIERGDKKVRVDFKTTAIVHRYEGSWQLSAYDYLDMESADELEIWSFDQDGNLKIVPVDRINNDNIERLFDCERKGETFNVTDGVMLLTPAQFDIVAEATEIIKNAELAKKAAEKRIGEVKTALINAMLKNNVKNFENDTLKITLVPAYQKQAIDSTKLKEEMPSIYNKYLKTSNVGATVKISMKGDSNE